MPSRAKQAIAIAFAISALFGLGPSRAQQSIEEGAGDPSTPLGRSMNQNQQEQQQNQQNMQRDQQNWNQYMHGQQNQQNQSNQGGYYQAPSPSGPSYGAIYVGVGVNPVVRFSYNYPTLISAKAAARQACQTQTGSACKEALAIKNNCGAIAVATNGLWASRSDDLDVKAADEAMTACHASSKHDCDVKAMYCVPNNN